MHYLLIDSSYFNFYRFFATKKWYTWSPDRVSDSEGVDWVDNEVFMKTYEKMWFETVNKLIKRFTPDKMLFARDGSDVWRYQVFPEYKEGRPSTDDPSLVFKRVNEHYHNRVKGATVIKIDIAEADDIIAVAVDHIQTIDKQAEITIITSDHDMLQLCRPGVEIWNLKGKKFTNITTNDPYTTKMLKILAGDPSDNIKGSFPRCGKKTALKLMNDPNLLNKWIYKHGSDQYKLNCFLIDFNMLPVNVRTNIRIALALHFPI